MFKASQSVVWVELSVKTDSASSENLIPDTFAAFKLHFWHLKNCSTFAYFERFFKYNIFFCEDSALGMKQRIPENAANPVYV